MHPPDLPQEPLPALRLLSGCGSSSRW